eukprot:12116484-Alexandrium_andersonii.AAC.1
MLQKEGGRPHDPMNLRLLLILPVAYRRWAALRLHQLQGWADRWAIPEIYAGLKGRSAAQAWWDTALDREWRDELGTPWARLRGLLQVLRPGGAALALPLASARRLPPEGALCVCP